MRKAQVSIELLLVLGVTLLLAVAFLGQVQSKAGQMASAFNATADSAIAAMGGAG